MQIVQDHHADSVVALFVHAGVPVIIHDGGRYPSFVTDDGKNSHDVPHIEIALFGSTMHAPNGTVTCSWDYASVSVNGGWDGGYRRRLHVQNHNSPRLDQPSRDALIAHAKLSLDRAVDTLASIDAQYAAAAAVYQELASLPHPLTRGHYEAACSAWGIKASPDVELSEWGEFAFPEYDLKAVRTLRLHQLRAFAAKREREDEQAKRPRTYRAEPSRRPCKGCGETHPGRFTTIVGGDYCDDCL
jgi:hypothetical protein